MWTVDKKDFLHVRVDLFNLEVKDFKKRKYLMTDQTKRVSGWGRHSLMVALEREPNELPIWQGHIAAAEAHYCQMCFVFQEGVISPLLTSPLSTLPPWQLCLLVLLISSFSTRCDLLSVCQFTVGSQSLLSCVEEGNAFVILSFI